MSLIRLRVDSLAGILAIGMPPRRDEKIERAHVPSLKDHPAQIYSKFRTSMVAEVHRILTRGFMYSKATKDQSKAGKLRLLYEANPMSFIVGRRAV